MFQNAMTFSQGLETWKKATEQMVISAYCPLVVEIYVRPTEVPKEEDKSAFGTHLREASRILRGR